MPEVYEVIKSSKANGSVPNIDPVAATSAANGKNGTYTLIALSFKLPSYIKVSASRDIVFDSKLNVDGDTVSYEGAEVGKVIERKSVSDVKVDTSFDIKYIGGYSTDGKTVYLDRDFPKTLNINGKEVDCVESIAKHHELTEKWMVGEGYTYQYAHIIANKIEREYVESLGVDWSEYDKEVKKYIHQIFSKTLLASPPDLDLAPYSESKDTEALHEIRDSTQQAEQSY